LYSVYMQQLSGGKVFSFEPTPHTFKLLNKTIHINSMEGKINPVAAAVADKTGKAIFNIAPSPASVANSLVSYGRPRKLYSCEVEVITIDDFVKKHHLNIGFIKIDAEGVELGVLKGATETIRSQRPVMVLGLHPDAIAARQETNEMIWQFLKNMNYAIFYEGKEMTKDEFCENSELFDVHLVPAEQTN
jgi:FkbM family methyltransferase